MHYEYKVVITDSTRLQGTCDTWAREGWRLTTSAVTGASAGEWATAGRVLGQPIVVPTEFKNEIALFFERSAPSSEP